MTAFFSAENQKIGALTESRVAYAYYSHIQKKRKRKTSLWLA